MLCPIRDTPHAVSPRSAAPQVGALKYHKFSIKLQSNFKISFFLPLLPSPPFGTEHKETPKRSTPAVTTESKIILVFPARRTPRAAAQGSDFGVLHGDPAHYLVPEWQTRGVFSPW